MGLEGAQTQIAESTSWIVAADFGILFKPFEKFQLGASYENLSLNTAPGSVAAALQFGISYEVPLDGANSFLTAASGSIDPGGVNYLDAGVEYSLNRRFFLRAGYQQPLSDNEIGGLTGLTAGAGFIFSNLSLDYAYLPYGNLGTSHRISLSYQFGTAKPAASGTAGKITSGPPSLPGAGTSSGPSPPAGQFVPKTQGNPQGGTTIVSPGTAALPNGQSRAGSPLLGRLGPVVPKASSDSPGDKDSLIVQFDMPSDALSDGKALEKQGQYQQAFRLYKAALRQNPRDASVWWAMGNLYLRFNQKEYAVQCFEQVVKLRPGDQKLSDWLEKNKALKP